MTCVDLALYPHSLALVRQSNALCNTSQVWVPASSTVHGRVHDFKKTDRIHRALNANVLDLRITNPFGITWLRPPKKKPTFSKTTSCESNRTPAFSTFLMWLCFIIRVICSDLPQDSHIFFTRFSSPYESCDNSKEFRLGRSCIKSYLFVVCQKRQMLQGFRCLKYECLQGSCGLVSRLI